MVDKHGKNDLDASLMDKADRNGHSPGVQGGFFEIHVRGQLDSKWSDWLDGLDMKLLDNGEMTLSGVIVDQAALMGILNKLNRLNLTLLSVSEIGDRNNA